MYHCREKKLLCLSLPEDLGHTDAFGIVGVVWLAAGLVPWSDTDHASENAGKSLKKQL